MGSCKRYTCNLSTVRGLQVQVLPGLASALPSCPLQVVAAVLALLVLSEGSPATSQSSEVASTLQLLGPGCSHWAEGPTRGSHSCCCGCHPSQKPAGMRWRYLQGAATLLHLCLTGRWPGGCGTAPPLPSPPKHSSIPVLTSPGGMTSLLRT
jgi:hypothetical protein